jgi:hypothetical protein
MRYRIEYLGPGFTAWKGFTIRNVEDYKNKSRIPTFNTDNSPITEGLKLLEKGGKIKIVDLDTVEEPDKAIEEPVEEPTKGPVEEFTEVEVESVEVEEPIETVEFDGEEVKLTKEALDKAFTSTNLDDICKENDISGYSTLNKGEKIDLIIDSL